MALEKVTAVNDSHDFLPVYKTGKGGYIVNARELHSRIFKGRTGRNFSTWMQAEMKENEWLQDVHYALQKVVIGQGRPRIEYALKLEEAEKVLLKDKGELGKLAREWFVRLKTRFLNPAPQPLATLPEHVERQMQLICSNEVNTYNYEHGGRFSVINYNRVNCILHTGKRPKEIIELAKEKQLPLHWRTSAKEVLRHTRPEIAASMALTDQLVRRGFVINEAYELAKLSQPFFAALAGTGLVMLEVSSQQPV